MATDSEHLGKRIDDLRGHVDTRFDDLRGHFDTRFDDQSKRLDDQNKRIDDVRELVVGLGKHLRWAIGLLAVVGLTVIGIAARIFFS